MWRLVSAEFQASVGRLEAEVSERSAQIDALTAQLEETQTEKSQLVQQVATINSLLEASQTKKEEDNNQVGGIFWVGRPWSCLTSNHSADHCGCLSYLILQGDAAELEQLKLR